MEYTYRTDIGRKRPNNQDYVGLFANTAGVTLAIVADGMGATKAAMSPRKWPSLT